MSGSFARSARPVAVALLLATAGCGGVRKLPLNESVEGIVRMDGAPLPNVMVQFVPDNTDPTVQAPPSRGYTDDQGRFRLECDNGKPGAVLGSHHVTVVAGRSEAQIPEEADAPAGKAAARRAVPTDYARAVTTPLGVEVTPDKHSYELDLTSKR